MSPKLERAKEVIELQFSHEILLKHREHRLVSQELAKCQVALEQLRRCHLIPYLVNVPTPERMLNVTNGQGPALQANMSVQVPQWAPAFGVVDGPYARHLAKWLIPDPKFDGIPAPTLVQPENTRTWNSVDARLGRNSTDKAGVARNRGRRTRGLAGQKLQALPYDYSQPRGKAGPCILKRTSDGKIIKSHEEAAIACGHSINRDKAGGIAGVQPSVVHPAPIPTGPAHIFAHGDAMTYLNACFSVTKRIDDLLESSLSDAPNLAELAKKKGLDINITELVREAKTKVEWDFLLSLDDKMDDRKDDFPDGEIDPVD
ncbi:hypothetical protein BKA67DRAFT_696604 [Truncatella angustata]|uniref:Uncharacterized protein n=1 Tax=Truncatella angustata TaxID=152316 RepID=A0A9P8RGI6_9PEZI|nr:uncharacterized protein BKA67DRAFT_696604 [Truncatella angustata]KAH6645594.1 hypothetical protein BKA67DRAFT_696604 [Truncatella angustata]